MWYALLLAACIAGDQLLKYWVVRHLEIGQSAAFLPGLVRLTRLHNTGAAWGSFSGMGIPRNRLWKRWGAP